MLRPIFLFAILVIIAVAAGCSTSVEQDLTQPAKTGVVQSPDNAHSLLGYFQFRADPDAGTLDVVALRDAAMHLNALQFLEPPPLLNLTLESLEFNGNIIETDIGLRHPFLGLTEFTGFDVCGIFISNGSIAGFDDPLLSMAGEGDTRLLNPDGLTRWWNPDEFPVNDGTMFSYKDGLLGTPNSAADYNCTLNAYKYFCDDLDPDEGLEGITLERRGVFSAGAKNVRHYTIELGAGLIFNYAVDANWLFPTGQPPWQVPDDFPPEANRPEAYRVSINELENSLFFLFGGGGGGNLSLLIDVYDWSDPGLNSVSMEAPGVIPFVESSSPIGGGEGYSTYQLDIVGATPTDFGPLDILISVVDPATGYQSLLPGENITAYFVHNTIVSNEAPKQATVLDIDPSWGFVDKVYSDVVITGEDFINGCLVRLEHSPTDIINGTNVTWVDSTSLEVDFDLTGATLGLYDVLVINPGATAGSLDDGFEVKDESIIWPVSQGNPAHTGYVGLDGPTGNLSAPNWTSDWNDGWGNALEVFLSDDTAFFSLTGHSWYSIPAVAVNLSDGSTKWTKELDSNPGDWTNVRGLNADGTVVLVNESSQNLIAGLDADDGEILWTMSGSMMADAYTSLDQNGNFIIPISAGVRSVVPATGTVNWTASIGNPYYCTPGVGPDGTIYVHVNGISSAQLHALNPATGADKWSYFPSVGRSTNDVTVTPDGDIICFGESGLFCFTDNGSSPTQKWSQLYPMIWYGSVAVDSNGDIIFFDGNGVLRRVNPSNGTTISSTSGWGDYGTRPAIGDNGLIYTNNEYYFRVYNSDLTVKWQYYGGFGSYFSACAIGQDGWVYSAKRDMGLYAWHD